MVTDQDKAELPTAEIGELLNTLFRVETFMLKEGKTEFQTECPRCGDILRARLVGRNNHIRMACDGQCGMSCLE